MKVLAYSIIILLFTSFVYSQKTTSKSTPKVLSEKEKKVLALKFQAVYIVEKTAEETPFWEDKKAAVEALTDAADLLWNENSAKSARWLMKAWTMIDDIIILPQDEKVSQFRNTSVKSDLRAYVLQIAQKRDTKLADKFIKQLADKEVIEKKEKAAFDDRSLRSEQLLNLAQEAIEKDPNMAFSFAERSLADGISYSLQSLLTDLRKKDANLANRLFDLAMARFTNNIPDTSEAQILLGYLFRPDSTWAAKPNGETLFMLRMDRKDSPVVAQNEPQRAKSFLSAVYRLFFAQPISLETAEDKKRAYDIYYFADGSMNYYDQYAPELGQSARIFLTQLRSRLFPNAQNQTSENKSETSKLSKNASKEETYEAEINDLESKADKEIDPIAKRLAYIKAVFRTKPEDYKRGKQIAEKIEDENVKAEMVSFLLYRATLYFLEKKKTGMAEELAPQIKEPLRRSVAKITIAQTLLHPKADKKIEQSQLDLEKQRAFDLLDDSERDLKRENATINSVKILFGTITVLAKIDKMQGLSLLEETIQKINQLETFNLKEAFAPKLGINVYGNSGVGTQSTPRVGFGLRDAIEPLVETDFEQVVSIVERLGKKEIRGVGRLVIAKMFFEKNKSLLLKQKEDFIY
jgi:hypothetical protein